MLRAERMCKKCDYFAKGNFTTKHGECRYNPPVWDYNKPMNVYHPTVREDGWCGKFVLAIARIKTEK